MRFQHIISFAAWEWRLIAVWGFTGVELAYGAELATLV
jgi:hypothetical protein